RGDVLRQVVCRSTVPAGARSGDRRQMAGIVQGISNSSETGQLQPRSGCRGLHAAPVINFDHRGPAWGGGHRAAARVRQPNVVDISQSRGRPSGRPLRPSNESGDHMSTVKTVVSPATPLAGAPPADAMMWIPGGTFTMGSDHHYPEEAPAHKVNVAGF